VAHNIAFDALPQTAQCIFSILPTRSQAFIPFFFTKDTITPVLILRLPLLMAYYVSIRLKNRPLSPQLLPFQTHCNTLKPFHPQPLHRTSKPPHSNSQPTRHPHMPKPYTNTSALFHQLEKLPFIKHSNPSAQQPKPRPQ
jgi:hypothetical protein